MSAVVSDAYDPWHSDFTAMNESYLAELLHAMFGVKPHPVFCKSICSDFE